VIRSDSDSPQFGFSLGSVWRSIQRIDLRLWVALFTSFLVLFAWGDRAEMLRMLRSFRAANPWWLGAIIICSLAIQLLFASKLVQLLGIFGHRAKLLPTAEAQLERHAIATVVPVGGAPALLLFLRRLTATGMPESDVLLSFVLFGALGHVSFALLLVPTIVWLALYHGASPLILAGSAGLILAAVGLAALALASLRGIAFPARIGRWTPTRIDEFFANARGHGVGAHKLLRPLGSALTVDLAGIAMLDAALHAVRQSPSLGVVAAGYCVGTLFLLMAPVFQGIGLVEV
jgi:uncharacterized membrane protein YbhN (UPF0104 family)